MGERTGNAAIEELIVGLHLLLGFNTTYRMDQIGELSRLVRDLSGVHYSNNKPIIGEENYTRESGIGVDLVMKNPLAMFATAPQLFGREGKVVLGKKSGKASITYTLERLGIKNATDQAVTEILKEVKARGTEKRALLSIDEFKEIVTRILK
jgi:methanogen homocitrate synthase